MPQFQKASGWRCLTFINVGHLISQRPSPPVALEQTRPPPAAAGLCWVVVAKHRRACVSRQLAAFLWDVERSLHFPTVPFGNYSSKKCCGKAGRVEQGAIILNSHRAMPGLRLPLAFLFILLVYVELLACFLV